MGYGFCEGHSTSCFPLVERISLNNTMLFYYHFFFVSVCLRFLMTYTHKHTENLELQPFYFHTVVLELENKQVKQEYKK